MADGYPWKLKMTGRSAVKSALELLVIHAVRMPRNTIEHEEIDHVDHADCELGQLLAQDLRRRERLDRWHVAGCGEDDVRSL